MSQVYFRTIFYTPTEIPFIKMNLMESYPYVDKFIIIEGNRTHVGGPKQFVFDKYLQDIPKVLREKICYIPADISPHTVDCSGTRDGKRMHTNEGVLWDCFEDYIDLKDDDIVLAADADEVIYQHMYPLFFEFLKKRSAFFLPLHQFFYRMNYLWERYTYWAPVVCRASHFLGKPRPHKWRYDGEKFPFMTGCHFSWQLTIEQMIFKLQTYAHNDIYGHFADPDILSAAVREKPIHSNQQGIFRSESLIPMLIAPITHVPSIISRRTFIIYCQSSLNVGTPCGFLLPCHKVADCACMACTYHQR